MACNAAAYNATLHPDVPQLPTEQQLLTAFFHNYSLADAHLSSYNWFLTDGIKDIIDAQAQATIRVKCDDGNYRDYLSLHFGQYYISPPMFDNDMTHRRNALTHTKKPRMFPNDARLHNLNYNGNMWIDVDLTWHDLSGHTHKIIEHEKPSMLPHVFIGKMPIMVRSDLCSWTLLDQLALHKRDITAAHISECEYDCGGYFIVNGSERVIIAQEHIAHNQLFIRHDTSTTWTGEYRSTRNDTMTTTNTIIVHVAQRSNAHFTCMVRIPYVDKDIPFFIIMAALGMHDYESIAKLLDRRIRTPAYLKSCFRQMQHALSSDPVSSTSTTTTAATTTTTATNTTTTATTIPNVAPQSIEYRALLFIANACKLKPNHDVSVRIQSMRHKLLRDLFTNVPITDVWSKQRTLLTLYERVCLATLNGTTDLSDIDHMKNRRVDFSGTLLTMLFRNVFDKISRDARISLQRDVSQFKKPDFTMAFRHSTLTHTFNQALATGTWFHDRINVTSKSGVSQQLNRQCINALYASLRRINHPMGRDSKATKPRALHNSTWGRKCPCKTPEGQAVGLVTSLALLCRCTIPLPRFLTYRRQLELYGLTRDEPAHVVNTIRVYVNGAMVGYMYNTHVYALTERIRQAKCDPIHGVHPHTSVELVCVSDTCSEIYLRTDGGRLIRPLFREAYIDRREQPIPNTFNWHDLESAHLIEWVDAAEEASCNVHVYFRRAVSESSESNMIDITAFRELYDASILSITASLVPFLEHNPATRNMYHASMSEQVISVPMLNYRERMDTQTYCLNYLQRPLAQTIIEQVLPVYQNLPSGQIAIMAILCYSGYNMDDSVILCKQSVERGFMSATSTRSQRCERRNYPNMNEQFGTAGYTPTSSTRKFTKVDVDTGVPLKKTYIEPNDVLVAKTSITYGNDGFESHRRDSSLVSHHSGYVDDVYQFHTDTKGNEMVRVRTRRQRIPEVGDKFTTRHGQKGVTGQLMNQWDMPFNPITGMTPDIIVNPHGIPSRMTIGQLRECLASKAAAISGNVSVTTPIEHVSDEEWKRILRDAGMDSMGREQLIDGRTGEPLYAETFMGPVYVERLAHLVSNKEHARSHGPVQVLTRQPVEGRANDGGLRWGEMERDSMIAHGAPSVLLDRTMQSDAYKVSICHKCSSYCKDTSRHEIIDHNNASSSNMTTIDACDEDSEDEYERAPTEPGAIICTRCGSSEHVHEQILPYSSKLFTQEVQAVGISMKMKFE